MQAPQVIVRYSILTEALCEGHVVRPVYMAIIDRAARAAIATEALGRLDKLLPERYGEVVDVVGVVVRVGIFVDAGIWVGGFIPPFVQQRVGFADAGYRGGDGVVRDEAFGVLDGGADLLGVARCDVVEDAGVAGGRSGEEQ